MLWFRLLPDNCNRQIQIEIKGRFTVKADSYGPRHTNLANREFKEQKILFHNRF